MTPNTSNNSTNESSIKFAKIIYKIIKWIFSISSFFFIFMLVTIVLLSVVVVMSEKNDEIDDVCIENGTVISFPDTIESQRTYLSEVLEKYNIPKKYENQLLAQLYQESGANEQILETDPWQSSESLCGSIGCITSPLESTEQAIKVHQSNFKTAELLEIQDENAILQAYNFGSGFLYWMEKNNYMEYNEDISYEYSVEMTKKNPAYASSCPIDATAKKACYGDYKYVEHVQSKLQGICGVIVSGDLKSLPMKEYVITQSFGAQNNGYLGYTTHLGIDFDYQDSSPIYSAGDGIILYSGCNDSNCGSMQDGNAYGNGFGNMVVIDHGDGLWTIYGHMLEHPMVEIGESVTAGTQIGKLGNTGNSTGSHLHFEVHEHGNVVDPNNYLPIYENAITVLG